MAGFADARASVDALTWCDGVMLGREAYHRPFAVLSELEHSLYPETVEAQPSREQILERMARYASRELARGGRLPAVTRHMLGLYGGQPGAREYRRFLSEGSRVPGAGADLLINAGRLASVRQESSSALSR